MSLLSKANSRNHCRTCLIKINIEENGLETKDICIAISGNNELQSFLDKYIFCEQKFAKCLERFPQHVCLDCFKLIQQADKFLAQAKLSANKLYVLISENAKENAELQEENTEIDKLLLKDSLLEMESVLMNNTLPNNEEAINTDPFSENMVLKKAYESSSQSSNCSNEYSEWHTDSLASGLSENSNRKNLHSRNAEIKSIDELFKQQKKKRRSKQEMEEYRRQQREKIGKKSNKYKRRPQGTKNKFRCTQCDHRFAHQLTLDVHIRKIHEGNPRPYQCEHCPKTYVALTGLTSHNQVEHSKDPLSYKCDFPDCNRSYTGLMSLQNHKRIKHSDPSKLRKFICEKCGETFWKKSLLIYHRRAKHPTEAEKAEKPEIFQCDVCHRTLATKHSLKYHKIKYHSGEMKYKCDVCGQKLAQKASVEYHKLLHSTEKVPCKDCGKQFVREYDLNKHVRVVHMKLKPYKCSYCPESFASNKTMKHHQFTHTGEKPYACNLCDKSYRQPTCLKTHLKTHEKAAG